VSWRKASAPSPLIVGKMVFTADNRFQVAHVPDREEWNLLIKNVNHDDAGLYECQVSSKEKYIRRIVRVIVKDRPYADRAIVINGPHTVKRGESLLLSCNATGGKSAPSDLDWMKDDKKLTADKSGRINITKHISYVTNTIVSNLTIKKVVESDEGVYVCRTSDEMVKNVSIEVTGEGSENVKRTISQDAPATSCATSSTFVLYMFVFVVHCSLRYSQLVHLVLFFCGYLWRSQEFPIS
ncbi:BASI-like protein, partial [Mya arenaria]